MIMENGLKNAICEPSLQTLSALPVSILTRNQGQKKGFQKNWTWLKKRSADFVLKIVLFLESDQLRMRVLRKRTRKRRKAVVNDEAVFQRWKTENSLRDNQNFLGWRVRSALAHTHSKQKRRFIVEWLCFATRVWDVSETSLQLSTLLKKSKRISLKVIVFLERT